MCYHRSLDLVITLIEIHCHKPRQHVLMTKFYNTRKTGCSDLVFRMFKFLQFHNEDEEVGKHEDNLKTGYI
jgi:hypothetical protein